MTRRVFCPTPNMILVGEAAERSIVQEGGRRPVIERAQALLSRLAG